MAKKSFVLGVQVFFGEMGMTLKENNVGTVALAGTRAGGASELLGAPKSGNGLGFGLLKVTRSDSWRDKVDIAQGSFTI